MVDDWVTVVPAPENIKATARQLLALAASPGDVRTRGNGSEFLIPPYLADLYNRPTAPKRRRANKEEVKSDGSDLFEAGAQQGNAADSSE